MLEGVRFMLSHFFFLTLSNQLSQGSSHSIQIKVFMLHIAVLALGFFEEGFRPFSYYLCN